MRKLIIWKFEDIKMWIYAGWYAINEVSKKSNAYILSMIFLISIFGLPWILSVIIVSIFSRPIHKDLDEIKKMMDKWKEEDKIYKENKLKEELLSKSKMFGKHIKNIKPKEKFKHITNFLDYKP